MPIYTNNCLHHYVVWFIYMYIYLALFIHLIICLHEDLHTCWFVLLKSCALYYCGSCLIAPLATYGYLLYNYAWECTLHIWISAIYRHLYLYLFFDLLILSYVIYFELVLRSFVTKITLRCLSYVRVICCTRTGLEPCWSLLRYKLNA